MRLFCLRHLFLIFTVCLIATSSYVLFDLLDIDGSNFKEHVQVLGFEAVMPACSGETKPPATEKLTPWPALSRAFLLTSVRLTSPAPNRALSPISHYLTAHIRRTIQRDSSSPARGTDPAKRSA